MAKASRDFLKKLCPINSQAIVEFKERDKYNRILGKLQCKNSKEVNRQMVLNGYAWAYKEYSKEFIKEEENARRNKKGLWKDKNPVYPQKFRRE